MKINQLSFLCEIESVSPVAAYCLPLVIMDLCVCETFSYELLLQIKQIIL